MIRGWNEESKMKCSSEVPRGMTRVIDVGYSSQCQREAIVVINGKGYCWQHHPDKVKEREKEAQERRMAKWRSKQRVREKYLELIAQRRQAP